MTIFICDEIDPAEFMNLHQMLSEIRIPHLKSNNRKNILDSPQYMCFGLTKARYTNRIGNSSATRKYPHIWEEIKRIGGLLKVQNGENHIFSSVHLNYNVVCGAHRDKNNIGQSVLVGFGDYEGGELCTEFGDIENINCRPVAFNGSFITHWNTPIIGNKWSLVFYVHRCALQQKQD